MIPQLGEEEDDSRAQQDVERDDKVERLRDADLRGCSPSVLMDYG